MTDQHPDPNGEATARVAQLAAMAVSVAEALARLRAQRLQDGAITDQQASAAGRAQQMTQAANARLVYTQVLNETWARQASTSELLTAWSAAGPHRDTDPLAGLASDRIEERLRRLHPEAMNIYDTARTQGAGPIDGMTEASRYWRGGYGLDPVGTPPGQPPTRSTDLGRSRGYTTPQPGPGPHLAVGPSTVGQAAAAQAFPIDIHQTMTTAPQAAKALRALPPAPVRKQLTATPTAPGHVRSTP